MISFPGSPDLRSTFVSSGAFLIVWVSSFLGSPCEGGFFWSSVISVPFDRCYNVSIASLCETGTGHNVQAPHIPGVAPDTATYTPVTPFQRAEASSQCSRRMSLRRTIEPSSVMNWSYAV